MPPTTNVYVDGFNLYYRLAPDASQVARSLIHDDAVAAEP